MSEREQDQQPAEPDAEAPELEEDEGDREPPHGDPLTEAGGEPAEGGRNTT